MAHFTIKEKQMFDELDFLFHHSPHIDALAKIIDGNMPNCSLRSIEMCVRNHSQYVATKNQYGMKYFDIFRRHKPFTYHYDTGKSIQTSLAQLNMLRFIFDQFTSDEIENDLHIVLN